MSVYGSAPTTCSHYLPLPLTPLSHSWDNSQQYGKTPKLLMVSISGS